MPAITYGLKGPPMFEVIVARGKTDLHSGPFGGTVPTRAMPWRRILASPQDSDGRILVPVFYYPVRPLDDWERAEFAKLPFSRRRVSKASVAVQRPGGRGRLQTRSRRKWARPWSDSALVNGIYDGYKVRGRRPCCPKAGAKRIFRLVPDGPQTVSAPVPAHVKRLPPGFSP